MAVTLEEVLPLGREHTRALLDELRKVGRTASSGTVLTGAGQGALAAVGFWITGVPEPLFLGVATAMASLVPASARCSCGCRPGSTWAVGRRAMAATQFAWGALLVEGSSDYLIRPRLVGDEGMPAVPTFLAPFGGLEVFGLRGLIARPA